MRLLIVDATNNFLRNYAIVPTLTQHGDPNGGVYGMLNSLRFFIRITNPDRVILAWDGPGGSKKRRAIIKEYKLGRKPARLNRNFEFELVDQEKNKVEQRKRLALYLNDLPITQITVDEVEADDIIAYLVNLYPDDKKIIASSDKDFYQLLDENTIIYNTRKKQFLSRKNVFEEFKIHPRNFALARAITGDKTDNLAGVRGVGLKNLLKYFPMFFKPEKIELEQLFKYCEENGEKYKKFLENKEIIINNLKVMRLDSSIIGFHSIGKIHESLDKQLFLNGTSFRVKVIEDGMMSIGENYLQPFRVLEIKGKDADGKV